MSTCSKCSTVNPPSAKFCSECGTKLGAAAGPEPKNYTPKHLADKIFKTRAAMEGERKRVTVLFCDIKGSTKLAQEAGAEVWHGILDHFFSILGSAVHRYEGTVNQYTGDGIMALFGAPIAHEDHAQRACFAALMMQREVRRYADELRLQKSLNLSMRVGLNTGEVIVGKIGDDLRMDYTAQGPTVNLAARMEHICEPGRVYLTRNTARLAEGYFQLRDLGRMKVEGVDEAVEVYELEGEGAHKTRLDRSLARGASTFVGRENELALLTHALDRVRQGEGQIVAVIGNAGIGKSRLCHEFTQACENSGIAVHRSTGVPYGNAVPMLPIQTLSRARLGLPERASAAELRRLVAGTFLLHDTANASLLPAVFDFLGASETSTPLAPDQAATARRKMLDLLAQYLPCGEQPQILLVEDLHFLDTASEEFLVQLCQYIRSSKTLLLLNYRPEYVSEGLLPHLDEQIAVSALTGEQLENLACNWLGPHESLKGVAHHIRERASGNPFFVEEAVLALEEAGYIEGERGAYQLLKPIERWPVPDTVHALLAARMDRLEESHKTLLQSAAVVGQTFSPQWVHALAGGEIEEGLALLEDAGFVHQKKSGAEAEYAFCHPLMQEVAYGAQLESKRAQAHARLAQLLAQTRKPEDLPLEDSTRITHHWAAASEWASAGAWALNAARWAAARDVMETLRQFRAARDYFDRAAFSHDNRKGRIAARSGIIRMAQFTDLPREEVDLAYSEARKLAEECGDVPCMIELLLSYANEHLHRGDSQAAADHSARAVDMAMANNAGQMVHRFRLAVLLSHNAAGLPLLGIERVDKATGSGWRTEPIGEENYLSRGFYGLMQCWLGHLPEAEKNIIEAIAYANKEARTASWMYGNMVDYAWFSGRHELALPHAQQAVLSAESFGSPFFITVAARAQCLALWLNGRFEEAVSVMERVRPHTLPGRSAHQFEANHLATLARAYRGVQRWEDAHEAASRAIASAQKSSSRVWEIAGWLELLAMPKSNASAARVTEGLARCESLIASSGARGFLPWLTLARAHWATDAAQAAQHHQQALQLFEQQGAFEQVRRLQRI